MSKLCPGCNEKKDKSEFYKNKSMKDGLNNYCKICWKQHTSKYYDKNKEKIYKKTKEYIDKNKDTRNAYYRKKYAEDPTWSKKAQKKWNEKNRESRLEYHKKYREENPETKMRSYLLSHSKQRAKKKNVPYDLDYKWLDEQLSQPCPKTGWEFVYEANSPRKPSIDRIVPEKGYTKDNCQIVCVIYNYAKNMWTDDDVTLLAEAVLKR